MILKKDENADLDNALNSMILSASGWRGVFAKPDLADEDGGESASTQISQAHRIISGAAALVFAEYLQNSRASGGAPLVLVGCDTRPTGKAIVEAVIPVLLACGCDVRYAGFTAAPEIMAWARSIGSSAGTDRLQAACGFIYISASHNPIGHNGLKFGLTDGGVLAAEEAAKLIKNFFAFFEKDGGDFEKNGGAEKIETLISAADSVQLQKVYAGIEQAKAEAYRSYYDFCGDVAWGSNTDIAAALKNGLEKQPLGIVCDFNGSARTVSIDREFFSALGLKFEYINGEPGQIAHRIVPEGESLEPCSVLLEEACKRDASFMIGYVPDCDGDRGNLVVFDDAFKADALKARALEAQEVFALACLAELSHLVWTGELVYDSEGRAVTKAAVAVNDPTSMRIDRIAEAFGVSVFRAEVGEANVVSLARRLREEGYIVRILGEGSAGGNITHPSAVRDPINTVLAIVKLLSLRSRERKSDFLKSDFSKSGFLKPGFFEIWCKRSGQIEKYRDDFTLADIIASLPGFTTTPAYSKDAVLRITTKDHSLLKDRYQQIFLREWEERKEQLKTRFGICGWEAVAYNGLEEKRGLSRFGEAGRGGLKILFLKEGGSAGGLAGGTGAGETAYIWMRGSATEPVFRIMADAEGANNQMENYLLNWQRCMIMEADLVP
jgi:phosphoglucomutase